METICKKCDYCYFHGYGGYGDYRCKTTSLNPEKDFIEGGYLGYLYEKCENVNDGNCKLFKPATLFTKIKLIFN